MEPSTGTQNTETEGRFCQLLHSWTPCSLDVWTSIDKQKAEVRNHDTNVDIIAITLWKHKMLYRKEKKNWRKEGSTKYYTELY